MMISNTNDLLGVSFLIAHELIYWRTRSTKRSLTWPFVRTLLNNQVWPTIWRRWECDRLFIFGYYGNENAILLTNQSAQAHPVSASAFTHRSLSPDEDALVASKGLGK